MAFGFSDIRRRLQWRLEKLKERAYSAQIEALKRSILLLADPNDPALQTLTQIEEEAAEKMRLMKKRHFFTAVGQALSAWAKMEDLLVAMVVLLLNTDADKAGIVMYSNINFSVQLSIIQELMMLDPEYNGVRKIWGKMGSEFRELKDVRDRLAHHTVQSLTTSLDDGNAVLTPARFDTRRKSQSQKLKPLDYEQILKFQSDINGLIIKLAALLEAMREVFERKSSPQR